MPTPCLRVASGSREVGAGAADRGWIGRAVGLGQGLPSPIRSVGSVSPIKRSFELRVTRAIRHD